MSSANKKKTLTRPNDELLNHTWQTVGILYGSTENVEQYLYCSVLEISKFKQPNFTFYAFLSLIRI